MKTKLIRSFIAGLGMAVAATGVYAQAASPAAPATSSETGAAAPATAPVPGTGPGMGMGRGMSPGQGMGPGGPQAAGPHGMKHHGHGGDQGMGQLPQAVIDQLALTPAQKTQFDAAQAARKELWDSRTAMRDTQQKAMAEQFAKDTIDPRAMLAMQKKARNEREDHMDAVSQKWLSFWDGLSAAQKTTISNYMKSQHAQRAQRGPQQQRPPKG